MTVDPRAASGFADAVGAYERGRPGYPTGVVEELLRKLVIAVDASPAMLAELRRHIPGVEALGLNSASAVLDLAAGTGKLTRLLVPRVVASQSLL